MNTLIKFKQFVDEINADNSRLYKISVLEKHKGDEDISYFLKYIYDPFIITGISKKKLEKITNIDSNYITQMNTVKQLLEYIKEHNTGTDLVLANIEAFKSFYFASTTEDKDEQFFVDLENLFDRIIMKDVQLGVDAKTINKVIPNLISTFNVQLANKYFEDPTRMEGKEFALTTKIDGCRIIAIKENGEVKFFTRQGQEYIGLVDLEKEMKEFMPDGITLDGELTLLDKGDLDSGEQYKATTKLCRTKDAEKHNLKMLVFDAMKTSQFKTQKCDTPYSKRRAFLEMQFSNTDNDCPSCASKGRHSFIYFKLLPILYQGTDTSKITEWLDYNTSHGEEGVMINVVDAPYEFKRCWTLVKVKKFQDTEVVVTGFEEGTNKNAGRLGALICDYKGNELRVGGGYSEEDREYIWNHKEEYLGKKITVKYFEETTNAEGAVSLRFPTFVGLRLDC